MAAIRKFCLLAPNNGSDLWGLYRTFNLKNELKRLTGNAASTESGERTEDAVSQQPTAAYLGWEAGGKM